MQKDFGNFLMLAISAAATAACSDPASPATFNPEELAETETDGLSSASATAADGDTDTAGGGDSGGSGEPVPVVGGCLFSDDQAEALNVYGYRYQCRGVFRYKLEADTMSEEVTVSYGNLVEGESYEEPRVMGCCPAYDPDEPSCSQPHTQACLVDLTEQGCASIVYELNAAANERSGAAKEALLKAANYVASAEGQDACFKAFAVDTGIATTSPSCDADNSATVEYDQLAVGASWSFDPPGLIPNVTISIEDAEHQGLFPWTSDPEFPGDTCTSSWDNNTVVLLELDPNDPVFELTYGTAEVRGEGLIDRATLESSRTTCGEHCSGISISESAEGAELNWMLALGERGQTVDGVLIEKFRAELQGPIVATPDGRGGYVVAAGDALFALSGSAMGASATVFAPNLRPIYFRPARTVGWSVDPIHIAYKNAASNEEFDFFIGATNWE